MLLKFSLAMNKLDILERDEKVTACDTAGRPCGVSRGRGRSRGKGTELGDPRVERLVGSW